MKLLRPFLVLAVVVIGGGYGASRALDGALRKGVEAAGTDALGVATTLERAHLGLLGGKLELASLRVANPPGYGGDPFLSLGGGRVELTLTSLMADTIEMPRLEFEDLSLQLVQRLDGSNYRELIENLEGEAPEAPPAPEPASETAESTKQAKGWVIREVVFRNVSVTAVAQGELGGQDLSRQKTLTIPEVRLTDIGQGGEAAPLETQVGRMLEGLLEAVLQDSAGVLPEGLGNDLGAVLATGFEGQELEDLARDRANQELQKGLDKLFGK